MNPRQDRLLWSLGVAATLAFSAVTVDAYKRPLDVAHINPAVLVDVPVVVTNTPSLVLEPVVIISGKALKVSTRARCIDCMFSARPLTQGSGSVRGFSL